MLWSPAFFGVKPDLILKGGVIAARHGRSQRLDPDAAARPLPADVRHLSQCRRSGEFGDLRLATSLDKGLQSKLAVTRQLVPVKNTRGISKKSMVHNDATPKIRVDPETYRVTADGSS